MRGHWTVWWEIVNCKTWPSLFTTFMKAFNDAASIWRDALHNSSGVSATWRVFAKAHWREDDGTDLTLTAAAVAARMAELYSVASLSWELYLQPLFIFAHGQTTAVLWRECSGRGRRNTILSGWMFISKTFKVRELQWEILGPLEWRAFLLE